MLNNIPTGINRMARNVVRNHPNSFNCEVLRKGILRTGDDGPGSVPTLGGMGVMDATDETEVEYRFLGNGHALSAEGFSPSPMMREGDASFAAGDEFRFLIEPEHPAGHAEHFDLRAGDVVYLILAAGNTPPKIAFEVIGSETTSNIPPYNVRFVCNRRADIDMLTPEDYAGPHAP